MYTSKQDNSEHTEYNNYVVPLIEGYEQYKDQIDISGVPMWVLCYYDGMPESYINDINEDKKD